MAPRRKLAAKMLALPSSLLKLLESSSTKKGWSGACDAGRDDDWVSVFDFGIFPGGECQHDARRITLACREVAEGNGGGESGPRNYISMAFGNPLRRAVGAEIVAETLEC